MKLLEFLAALATDTEVMSAYRRSPDAALSQAGLSEADQRLILLGDPVALRQAVFAEKALAAHLQASEVRAGGPPDPQVEFPPPDPFDKFPPPDLPDKFPPLPLPDKYPAPPLPSEWPPPKQSHQSGPAHAAIQPALVEFPNPEPPPPPPPDKSNQANPSGAAHAAGQPTLVEFPNPEPPPPPPPPNQSNQFGAVHEAESVQVEPLDVELDLDQDALLAGIGSLRAMDAGPSGVWSTKGLTVVGMGMRAGLHMTMETRLAIEQAARVLYLVADPVSEACILRLNPAARPLGQMYETGKPRIEIYESIIATILGELESAGDLCVAFYGHAGVLTYPAWESIRRARATGKRARMLPAISTEDSLFADLGIDIGRAGLQSFEATRFLYYQYNFDSSVGLLLWQLGVLGEERWNPPHAAARPRLEVLTDYLIKFYGPEHEVYLYHSPELPTSRALIERVALGDLPRAEFISISTLYIPPRGQPRANEENLRALARLEVRQ